LDKYNFIRIEVQVLRPKVYYVKNKEGIEDSLSNYFSDDFRDRFFKEYIEPFIMSGEYYKLSDAKKIIRENFSENMTNKLYNFMSALSDKGNGNMDRIDVKADICKSTVREYKNKLASINVNPIPIPRRETIETLPNLYDVIMEENKKYDFRKPS